MGVWPDLTLPPPPVISPWSVLESIGAGLHGTANDVPAAGAVYPSANLGIFVPFLLTQRCLVTQLFVVNGTVVSGSVDAGIYDSRGTLLVSKGSTAQAGTSVLQALDVTDTPLGPGLFYMAVALSNTTGTMFSAAPGAELLRCMGVFQMAAAFPLPATATFATMAQAYMPLFGILQGRSVI